MEDIFESFKNELNAYHGTDVKNLCNQSSPICLIILKGLCKTINESVLNKLKFITQVGQTYVRLKSQLANF